MAGMRKQQNLLQAADGLPVTIICSETEWDCQTNRKNMHMVVKCVYMVLGIRTSSVVTAIVGRSVAIHQTQSFSFERMTFLPQPKLMISGGFYTWLPYLKLTGHMLPACAAPGSCLSGSTSWQKSLKRPGPWVTCQGKRQGNLCASFWSKSVKHWILSTRLPCRTNSGIVYDTQLKSSSG